MILEKLIVLYCNEKATKTLLPYNNLVDQFNNKILLKSSTESIHRIKSMIEEIESERIKYFIKEYILCRFDKITKNLYIDTDLLSPSESIFYNDYKNLIKSHDIYKENGIETSRNEFVGFIANRDIPGVKIDGEIIEIFEGDFFIAKLNEIEFYLADNSVSLA